VLPLKQPLSIIDEASDFKFGTQLEFAIKSHQKKSGCGPELGALAKIRGCPLVFLQRLKLATSNLVDSLGLPRPIIKSHPEEKVGVALG